MNKFAIVALLAIVGCVAVKAVAIDEAVKQLEVDSQLKLLPKDDEETKYLPEKHQIFTDFCLESRDLTKVFIEEAANGAAAAIFSAFFNSANEIGEEVIKVNTEAVREGVETIKSGQLPVPSSNPQETPAQRSLFFLLTQAAGTVVKAIARAAAGEFITRIENVKAQFGGAKVKEAIEDVCGSITTDLNKKIERKLNDAKRSAGKLTDVSTVSVQNLGCVTAGRVNKAAQVCNFMSLAGPAIYPMLGF